jgi:hypothetical protein
MNQPAGNAAPLRIGDEAQSKRAFGAADILALQTLMGEKSTKQAMSRETVPEALIGALFSTLLGVWLPGPGTNYLKQETRFLSPARRDEVVLATVRVTRVRSEKGLVDLQTLCLGADGRVIAEGRALVLAVDTGRILQD